MQDIKDIDAARAALLGRDYTGTRLEVLVEAGDVVLTGQPVMRDRRHPQVLFTAPAAGRVRALNRGRRRSVVSMEFEVAPQQESLKQDTGDLDKPGRVRELLLSSGIWTALRQRPFGTIPDPAARPAALFITAIDSRPLAPDPGEIIAHNSDAFLRGVELLAEMVEAPVFVCTAPGATIPRPRSGDIRFQEFAGPHPSGLPGTHIQQLCPVGAGSRVAWHIGYQDVMAFGNLVMTGYTGCRKVISVAGAGLESPRLVRVVPGCSIAEIVRGAGIKTEAMARSGSIIDAASASAIDQYLGQFHNQVTVLPDTAAPSGNWRLRPLLPRRKGAQGSPLLPTTDLDDAAPPGVLAVPLLRALLVEDDERAQQLGALELIEEDVAMLSVVCTSNTDYGKLLRATLDRLQKNMAVAA